MVACMFIDGLGKVEIQTKDLLVVGKNPNHNNRSFLSAFELEGFPCPEKRKKFLNYSFDWNASITIIKINKHVLR